MIGVVYHGSYTTIDDIDLSFCRKGRDFGQGFYVTKIRSQAEDWAIRKGKQHKIEGVVTEFGFHEELIDVFQLKVLRFEGYSKEWLDFIVANRNNKSHQQTHDYDMVEGPVADDDVATRIRDYLRGNVSKEQFLKELTHRLPSHQICFCTERSLPVLITPRAKINGLFAQTDNVIVQNLMMDYGKTEAEAMDVYYTSDTYTQYANEETGWYKKSWHEIYQALQKELNLSIKP